MVSLRSEVPLCGTPLMGGTQERGTPAHCTVSSMVAVIAGGATVEMQRALLHRVMQEGPHEIALKLTERGQSFSPHSTQNLAPRVLTLWHLEQRGASSDLPHDGQKRASFATRELQ